MKTKTVKNKNVSIISFIKILFYMDVCLLYECFLKLNRLSGKF